MKLYTYDPAPNPQRLAHFLKFKGLQIDTQQVDLATAEQLTPEHLAVNPSGTVPALVLDDGTTLSAVIGIVTYLDALHPEKPMLGSTPLEKAQIMSWCHNLFNGLTTAIASVFRNRSPGFADRALPGPLNVPQIPAMVERGQMQIDYYLPEINAHLADHTWLAGDNFSFADIDLYTTIGFLGWIKREIPQDCPHLLAWFERARAQLA
ncbi:MAG: glutathione S-transferase family protein [Gammaproteobacteria bacterium]|nr:glutathione S-transferase family protein [Gammaproteobacteria bacterium]